MPRQIDTTDNIQRKLSPEEIDPTSDFATLIKNLKALRDLTDNERAFIDAVEAKKEPNNDYDFYHFICSFSDVNPIIIGLLLRHELAYIPENDEMRLMLVDKIIQICDPFFRGCPQCLSSIIEQMPIETLWKLNKKGESEMSPYFIEKYGNTCRYIAEIALSRIAQGREEKEAKKIFENFIDLVAADEIRPCRPCSYLEWHFEKWESLLDNARIERLAQYYIHRFEFSSYGFLDEFLKQEFVPLGKKEELEKGKKTIFPRLVKAIKRLLEKIGKKRNRKIYKLEMEYGKGTRRFKEGWLQELKPGESFRFVRLHHDKDLEEKSPEIFLNIECVENNDGKIFMITYRCGEREVQKPFSSAVYVCEIFNEVQFMNESGQWIVLNTRNGRMQIFEHKRDIHYAEPIERFPEVATSSKTMKRVTENEAKVILAQMIIEVSPLQGKMLTTDMLAENGLGPDVMTMIDDTELYFSKPFSYNNRDGNNMDDDQIRHIHRIMYVKKVGKFFAEVFIEATPMQHGA